MKQHLALLPKGAPVSGMRMKDQLKQCANEVVILENTADYFAVSQVYYSFPDVTNEEVLELMERWEQAHVKPAN